MSTSLSTKLRQKRSGMARVIEGYPAKAGPTMENPKYHNSE